LIRHLAEVAEPDCIGGHGGLVLDLDGGCALCRARRAQPDRVGETQP
jgi:hypothetical protein